MATLRTFSPAQANYMLAKAIWEADSDSSADTLNLMRDAAFGLFDWATDTTLAKHGTPAEQKAVREAVAKVKTMTTVQRHWIALVDLCMKLEVAA
jgi:hypothetical protein